MKRSFFVILAAFGLFNSSVSFGWGVIGHRTTGQIAEANLSPAARQAVSVLLQNQHLADVATWADQVKQSPGFKHTATYHYENIPDNMTYLASLHQMNPTDQQNGGVVEGILVAEKIISNPQATTQDKSTALKFLIHFIGDLHQPLHTGRPQDRGGNDIKVSWFNVPSNLHSVWDTGLIVTGHRDLFGSQPPNSDLSVLYARFLINKFQKATPPQNTWGVLEAWLAESVNARAKAYDTLITRDQNAYVAENLDTLDSRVYYAGMRIAETMNRLFANQPVSPQDNMLFQNIQQIVGNVMNIITLGPRQQDGIRAFAGGNPASLFEGYQP